MKFAWYRPYTYLLIVGIILVLLLVFLGFRFYLFPVVNEISELEEQLEQQEKIISDKKAANDRDDDTLETSSALQQKLPLSKANDQLFILLEQVEQLTNSKITNFSIASDATNSEISSDLSVISYQLQVISESYQNMNHFLQELSNLDRLVNISSIQFGRGSSTDISYSVSFSTYYNPTLTELIQEAPSYDYTPSADKETPFPRNTSE